MAGLRELLVLRQLQDQADPVRSAFQSLAEGVAVGIENERQLQLEKRKRHELNEESMKLATQFNNTNSNKIGGLIPSVKIQEGVATTTFRSPTPSENIALEQSQLEKNIINQQNAFVRGDITFQDLSKTSGISTAQLVSAFNRAQLAGSQIRTTDSQSVEPEEIIKQASSQQQSTDERNGINLSTGTPTLSTEPKINTGGGGQLLVKNGKLINTNTEQILKDIDSQAEISKQVGAQEQKAFSKTTTNVRSAILKLDQSADLF